MAKKDAAAETPETAAAGAEVAAKGPAPESAAAPPAEPQIRRTTAPAWDPQRPQQVDFVEFKDDPNLIEVLLEEPSHVYAQDPVRLDGEGKPLWRLFGPGEIAVIPLSGFEKSPAMGKVRDPENPDAWVRVKSPQDHPWKLMPKEKEKIIAQKTAETAMAQRPEGSIAAKPGIEGNTVKDGAS